MVTVAHEIGAALVPPTLQVTCALPPLKIEPAAGAVTAKGPVPAMESVVKGDTATPPAPGWLSRTITRKRRLTPVTAGSCSPGVGTPLSTSAMRGKVRWPMVTGG